MTRLGLIGVFRYQPDKNDSERLSATPEITYSLRRNRLKKRPETGRMEQIRKRTT